MRRERRSKEEDNTDTLWHAHKHTRTHTPRRPEKEGGKQRHESRHTTEAEADT